MNVGLSLHRNNKKFNMVGFISTQQSSQLPPDSGLPTGRTPSPESSADVPDKGRGGYRQVKFIVVPHSVAAAPYPSSPGYNDPPTTLEQASQDNLPPPETLTWLPSSPSDWSTTSDSTSPPPSSRAMTPSFPPAEKRAQLNQHRRTLRANVKSQSAAPSPQPQAPSRRPKKDKERASPYTAAPLEKKKKKEKMLSKEREAEYAARLEEALNDPANKYYRREVIERSVYGADYRLSKIAKKGANNTSYRSPRERDRMVSDTPTTTATPSYESQHRSGHDPAENLPRQQVVEGQSVAHRPEPFVRIDNPGHPVSGIDTWDAATEAAVPVSPVPFALFMTSTTEQGQECNAFESLENPWADPTDYGHPFDLATPSQASSYPMSQTYSLEDDALSSRMVPVFTPFGKPSNIFQAPSANWLSSPFLELLAPGGNAGAW